MARFLLRRFAYLLVLVVIATSVAYVLAATQLNPRVALRRPQPSAAAGRRRCRARRHQHERQDAARHALRALGGRRGHGDFGRTIDNTSVNEEFGRRMWVSLRLLLIGSVVGTLLGVAAGAYGAVKQYRWSDRVLTLFSFVILSIPVVVLAVLFKNAGIGLNNVLGFTGDAKLLYTTGEITPGLDSWSWEGIGNRLAHLVLPSLVLAVSAVAFYGRYQRNAMLDVLGSDFLRTARAKGLPRTQALIRHGLRTALIPMATFFAYSSRCSSSAPRSPRRSSAGTAWASTSSTRSPRTT